MNSTDQIMQEMLQRVSAKSPYRAKGENEKLSVFFPIRGLNATGELMIVGRAVNGWHEWNPLEKATLTRVLAMRKEIEDHWKDNSGCPLSWVIQGWSRGTGYRASRSAFWRVAKALTERLRISTDPNTWPSYLIWSNLYKVSPKQTGNPSSQLINAQMALCESVLQKEIEDFRPKRLVVLAGMSWAKPFIEALGVEPVVLPAKNFVEFAGVMKFEGCSHNTVVVVGPHPQGKREVPLVDDLAGTLDELCRTV